MSEALRSTSIPAADVPVQVESRPDALLYALALMICTYVWRVQDLFPSLGVLQLNLLATAVAAGLFVLDRDPLRRVGLLSKGSLFCAAGLVCVAILGIPTSLWARNSATALADELLPNLLLMTLIAASVRGRRDLEWIALATLLGGCLYSFFALTRFDVDPSGRFGDLVYYDANDLALVQLCTMPIALYFLVRRGWAYRLVGAGSLVLIGAAFVRSGSRGGFLGLLAVLVFVLFAYRAIPARVRILAVVGGFGAFALLAGERYWEKMRTLSAIEEDYNWSGRAPEGRMEVWRRGVGYMADHPIVGVGLRNFQLAEGMLSEEAKARAERGRGFKWSAAHNSFLEVGVELGVTGLLLFLGLLGISFRALGRIRREPGLLDSPTFGALAFACTLAASLIGFCVAGMFVSADQFSLLYVLLGLTLALTKLHELQWLQTFAWPVWPVYTVPRARLSARDRASERAAADRERQVRRRQALHALPREQAGRRRGVATEVRSR